MQHLLFWKCTQKPKARFNQQTGLACARAHTHSSREGRPVTSRPKVIFYLKCWVCSKIHAPSCLALLMKGCMTGSPVSVPCIMCRSITGYDDGAHPASIPAGGAALRSESSVSYHSAVSVISCNLCSVDAPGAANSMQKSLVCFGFFFHLAPKKKSPVLLLWACVRPDLSDLQTSSTHSVNV